MEIDGMTFEQTRHNVYVLAAELGRQIIKRDHARKDATRAKWQKKIDETARYLTNNRNRLNKFVELGFKEI